MPNSKRWVSGLVGLALVACGDRTPGMSVSDAAGAAAEQPPPFDAAVVPVDAAAADAGDVDAAIVDARPAEAGDAADAGAAPDAAEPGPRVWSDTSASLEIEWTEFRVGSYRFRAERDRLSAEQLRLLRELEIVPGGPECPDMITWAVLIVTDEAGGVQRYTAIEEACGWPSSPITTNYLDYNQVAPLLATLGCRSIDSSSEPDLASAPHIGVGDGCLHGLHKPYDQPADWWLLVDIEAPGLYRFTIDSCISRRLRLEIAASAGTPVLAGMEGTANLCPLVEHELTAAGTYALHIVQPGGATPDDYYLIAEPVR
jgi:hypothetical protein